MKMGLWGGTMSNVGEKSGILRRRCPISWERSGILGEKKWSVVKGKRYAGEQMSHSGE